MNSVNFFLLISIRRNVLRDKGKGTKGKWTSNHCLYLFASWVKCHKKKKVKSDSQCNGFRSSMDFFVLHELVSYSHGNWRVVCPWCLNSFLLQLEKKRYSLKLCLPKPYSDQVSVICPSSLLVKAISHSHTHWENQMKRCLWIGRKLCSH